MCGLFAMAQPLFADEPAITQAFRSGKGVGWHEHDSRLYGLTNRIFRNGYSAHLVADGIPALEGVEAKLRLGATVADLGCGYGNSTILMAEAYRTSRFLGHDYHAASIEAAREAAKRTGVADRVSFEVASAEAMPPEQFDPDRRLPVLLTITVPGRCAGQRAPGPQAQRNLDDRGALRRGRARR